MHSAAIVENGRRGAERRDGIDRSLERSKPLLASRAETSYSYNKQSTE